MKGFTIPIFPGTAEGGPLRKWLVHTVRVYEVRVQVTTLPYPVRMVGRVIAGSQKEAMDFFCEMCSGIPGVWGSDDEGCTAEATPWPLLP